MLKEYAVPPHIIEHSMATAKLAVFLAKRLKEKGIAIDIELVDRACLLHDIVRFCDFQESQYTKYGKNITEQQKVKWRQLRAKYKAVPHEYAAYEILKDKYPVLALTVKKHRYMALLDEEERPKTWEEKLVYYADKRVMHDKIVPLKERLTEGHERNAHLHGSEVQSKINTAKVDPLIYKLEKEIFDIIGLDPVEITDEFIDSYSMTDRRLNRRGIK